MKNAHLIIIILLIVICLFLFKINWNLKDDSNDKNINLNLAYKEKFDLENDLVANDNEIVPHYYSADEETKLVNLTALEDDAEIHGGVSNGETVLTGIVKYDLMAQTDKILENQNLASIRAIGDSAAKIKNNDNPLNSPLSAYLEAERKRLIVGDSDIESTHFVESEYNY